MSDVSCLVNYKIQKMKKLRLFFVTLFFVLTNISSLYSATTYPIQLTAQLLPPYGNRLSDYVVDGMERINITALQRDLSWGYYDFYLQMQVKQGSNILLSASAQYKIAPGFVTQLQANALFSRLAEVKTSRPQIIENGFCLPEGAYEFVFQAFDATKRNLPVSEPAYCYAYLSKMQPCRCLVPADNSCVDYTSPTLNFMWLEPTVAMPSASKKYELEIYEMPQGFDPIRDNAESLLQSLEPIYTKSDISSDMTMAQVPQSAGLFVKGRSYVWRVRTRFGEKYTETTTGSYKLSNYIENNGYSKISTFHFKKCMGQEDIWSEKKKVIATDPTMKVDIEKVETDKSKVDVVWTNDDKFTCGYVVEWNLADTTKSPWGKISVGAGNSRCEIKGVRHGIEYVTRVRGMVCPKEGSKDTIYSAYSDTLHFLWEKEKGEYCGREVPVLQGSISLKSLQPGDWFTANGNDIKVLSCEMNTAGDTTFSGKGQVSYGFLTNVVSLMVEFNNVKINEQGELMEGVVYSVTDLNNCVDFNLNGLANKNSAGSGPAQMQSDFDFSNGFKDGSVGVEMRGETTTLVAKDGNGGSYEIGQLVEQEPINCAPKSNIFDDEQGLVKFAPQEAWNPPFDYEQGVFTKSLSISDYYEKIDRYSIPWIAVPSGESTKIYANLNLSAGVVKPEHVYFICRTNSKAIKLKAEKLDGNQFVVPIFGGEAGKYLELVAMADTSKNGDADCSQLFTLGRAKVLSMKKESYTLHIVPFRRGPETVDGTSIENTLNEIYKPLGKTFSVEVEERFGDGSNYDFVEDGLIVEGSGFMTTETSEMSLLKALYSDSHELKTERDHAYLFLLPKSATAGVLGDMPRNKHVGYLFADYSTSNYSDGYTVAHEVGHGIFTFDHSFEYCDEEHLGKTSNLMDYADVYTDPDLKVWQWNLMDTHPNYVLPFLEDDEDSELAAQIAQCLTAAALDVAFNYGFKWVELWYDENEEPAEITDYERIFGSMNTTETVTSALVACGSTFIPFNTQKKKIVATLTAAFGAGAVGMATEIERQYTAIHNAKPNLSTLDVLAEIEWKSVMKTAGTQAIIAGIATGATTYALTHPKFVNFATKIRQKGYNFLSERLSKARLSLDEIKIFCEKFDVKVLRSLDDFESLSAWKKSLGNNSTIAKKLENADPLALELLEADLKKGGTAADELKNVLKANPNVVDERVVLEKKPDFAFENAKETEELEAYTQTSIFKDRTKKGKDFEEKTCRDNFLKKASEYGELKKKVGEFYGVNLDEYKMYSQVQLKYDGNKYFIADQLFFKYNNTENKIDDIIIIENKLKSTTELTQNQIEAFKKTEFVVRSKIFNELPQNTPLKFAGGKRKIVKVYDSEAGEKISGFSNLGGK